MGRLGLSILVTVAALALPQMGRADDIGSIVATPAIFQTGMASYFSTEKAGRRTANGETCDPSTLTAAHRTLPLGSRVRVTDMDSGRSVIVRINDRGPYSGKRVIDLSRAAADEIGLTRRGHGMVQISMVD